jgi:hypothetical protein
LELKAPEVAAVVTAVLKVSTEPTVAAAAAVAMADCVTAAAAGPAVAVAGKR